MMTRTISRCDCGARKSQFSHDCKACSQRKRELRIKEALAIVATGVCPQCGSPLRRNSAMTGWWQCSQYGAVGFRADANKVTCGFQTFTA